MHHFIRLFFCSNLKKSGIYGKADGLGEREKKLKSAIRRKTYLACYRLLNHITPLTTDCGKLCNAACCTASQEDMGIYLLPGEDKVFTQKEEWLVWEKQDALDYDFPDSWVGKIHFIKCKDAPKCPRELRPLQCRFFPLSPHLTEEGKLVMVLCDVELPYTCPLISEQMPLNPSFVRASYTIWNRLMQEPLIYDLVAYDSGFRYEEDLKVITL